MLADNTRVVAMWVSGIILVGLLSWPLAAAYLGYCLLSTLLYMALICPYCVHYQGGCPSGYHLLASRLFKPKESKSFAQQFRRYIVVMLPVWLIPLAVGVYLLITQPSWAAGVLMALFCLVGFVVLPYASKQVTCKKCKNAEYCPWRQPKSEPQSP
jgi:hypothetical protein